MTNREIFDFVSDVGVAMVKNGGEVPRALMTMQQIGKKFGIENYDVYIIANGIFASGVMDGQTYMCKIRNVVISQTCLCRVEAINSLSRRVVAGELNPEQARDELERIKEHQEYSLLKTTIAMGIGSGAFTYLFRGTFLDCAMVVFVGMILSVSIKVVDTKFKLPKIMSNMLLAMIVSAVCCIFIYFGLGDNLGSMIIGAMMPLVPGIPLTNGVRDLVNDDYLSGVIRLVDAFLVGISLGCGVGVVLLAYNMLTGGMAL